MPEVPTLDASKLVPTQAQLTTQPDFLGYTAESWLALVADQGPVFKTTMADVETYIICGHEADLAAWKSPDDWIYGPPSPGGEFFQAELGEMHVTQLDGEAHRRARKLILPAFGVAAVTRDLEVVASTLTAGLRDWSEQTIDLHPVVSRLLTLALSRSQLKEALTDTELESLVTFEEAFIPASSLTTQERAQWYGRPAYQDAKQTAFTVFERAVDGRLQGDRQGDSLDLIMNRPVPAGMNPLGRDELIRAAYLLLVAGVGNIANILCAGLWGLSENPVWVEKLREELHGFEPLQLKEGMARFPILKAVISETERCYLPAPVIPKMTAETVDLLGYSIPGGVNVLQFHGLAHFESARYQEAFKFDPERWLSGDAARANAFGGGTHLCLGMGVTRLYVPLMIGLLVPEFDWEVAGPPALVSQAPELPFAPKTTRFPVAFSRR